VSFFIPHVYDIGLTVGQHYKLQLAYISKEGSEVGYYSTVGVAKYTTYPNLSIGGLDLYTINPYLLTFTGHYDQIDQDTTEKVYTYQFNLYKNNQLYNSSGWLLHNSSYDDSVSSSFDNYEF
jgi:hypothetical protein